MPHFRVKSPTVEAIQYLREENIFEVHDFFGEEDGELFSYVPSRNEYKVKYSKDGFSYAVKKGEFIIREAPGKYKVCKENVFWETYAEITPEKGKKEDIYHKTLQGVVNAVQKDIQDSKKLHESYVGITGREEKRAELLGAINAYNFVLSLMGDVLEHEEKGGTSYRYRVSFWFGKYEVPKGVAADRVVYISSHDVLTDTESISRALNDLGSYPRTYSAQVEYMGGTSSLPC